MSEKNNDFLETNSRKSDKKWQKINILAISHQLLKSIWEKKFGGKRKTTVVIKIYLNSEYRYIIFHRGDGIGSEKLIMRKK
jgi:hypothetical protein